MILSRTFSTYIARQFLFWFANVLFILLALILLFDTVELLRRASSETGVSATDVVSMALFKLPHMAHKAIPFSVLFAAMLAFWRLNRNHELEVVRGAGISAWQFILPVILSALLIGVFKITVFSPFSSAMLLRFEQLEAEHIRGKSSLAAISGKGLWLRQNTGGGHYVLHAGRILPQRMELADVIVFRFKGTDKFVDRIDAARARLAPKQWLLEDGRIAGPDRWPASFVRYHIPTDLTQENIQDSFSTPETMSFWTLLSFINVLEKAGFSGLRHRLYWHSLLADPLLLCAMVVLAAAFTCRPLRRGGGMTAVMTGVAGGFILYFSTDVVYALGLSARVPVLLAAWSPATVCCLLGSALLFHFEDG